MRLATIRTATGTRAVRVDGDSAVETGDADVRALLERPDWPAHAATAAGPVHAVDGLDYAPLVPAPEKILCVGQNYRDHIAEMGNEPPAYPTVFAKFAPALVGAHDEIVLPAASDAVDYEAELAVIIGRPVRHATPEQAEAAIAGYTVLNDVSARDWQYRTTQFLQGKIFEHTTPLGPWLVTPDELTAGGWEISTVIDGESRQHSTTAELVFGPVDLVGYLSTILTLNPGDVIATGTPGGVGHARKPPRYLTDGATMVTAIAGIGECRNVCRAEQPVAGGTP
ncbi:MAG: acylpyruvate hydrolase [Pseudonocardiales bacterium]|nr:acylpyruvate hydrolase [Pseudonocardiales bacterium]